MGHISTFSPTKKISVFETKWRSPSNIALVKYWGKKGLQLPANPSISFTLSTCATTTALHITPREDFSQKHSIEVYLDGVKTDSFVPKIEKFFENIEPYAPYLRDYHFTIHTSNSFPHSSGIASSASGMSALALCIVSLEIELGLDLSQNDIIKRASSYARIGSGSASRSIEGGLVVWGDHTDIEGSSDEFAIKYPYEVDDVFKNFCDTVLLIEKGQKSVSSTVGHSLMQGHPFAQARFAQANENISKLIPILKSGDVKSFGELVENEALTLHSMMLTASPSFILFKPNTIRAIELIWEFRKATGLSAYFTLDAGANVHLLYPDNEKQKIREFIAQQLAPLCANGEYIHDTVGIGATQETL